MVRDGYLAAYAEPGYAGEVMALGPGSVVRLDELGWHRRIGSVCASAEPFDPLAPPPAVLAAGTRSAATERKTSPDAPHSLIVVPPRPHWSRP